MTQSSDNPITQTQQKHLRTLKAAAISLSLLGCLSWCVTLGFALQDMKSNPQSAGFGAIAFGIISGCCFLGGAILSAVQPFVGRSKERE